MKKKEWMFAAFVALIAMFVMVGCPSDNSSSDDPEVTSVTVSPATASVAKGATQQFTANVAVKGGAARTVTWTVNSTISSISTSGVLTVGAAETATTLTVTATSTVDATKSGTATVTVTSGGGPTTELVEQTTLTNGWFAIYRFDLPAGATWEDFEKVTVDYKVDAATLDKNNRTIRLYGNYTVEDFEFLEAADGSGYKAIANYNQGKNAEYILHNGPAWGVLKDDLETLLGVPAVADEWFTLEYTIDGSAKHDSYVAANLPADTATGPFYFGVGLNDPNGEGGLTSQIKNVKLVGYPGVDSVIAYPAIFTANGNDYPAYAGYPTTDGSNGWDEANRTTISGTFNKIPVAIAPPDTEVYEEVTLENAWYAVYRFDLPAEAKWEDFEKITADYKLDAETLENNTMRGVRLMGNYTFEDFTFFEGDGNDKHMAVANYNGGKNAEYIFYNGGPANVPLKEGLATLLGATPDADTWFTLDYPIDGATKHGSYVAANEPNASATGPFYFGLGLTGQDQGGNTFKVKNVTLVSYDGEDVIAKPVVFNLDGVDYPAFTGYNTPDGSNGWAEANRRMINSTFEKIPVTIADEDYELVTLENAWYAAYQFTLPAGVKWEDFEKITADYKLDAETLENKQMRGVRLMGNYTEDDFELLEATEAAAKKRTLALANYNGGKNAEYIFYNGGPANVPLKEGLATLLGATPNADTWFTLDYPIDGATKHSSYVAANEPEADATGPFIFGLGLTGQGDGGNTFKVRNVKLVGYPGVDDVIAVPYVKDGIQAFAGYNTTDGSNGWNEAYRRTIPAGTVIYK